MLNLGISIFALIVTVIFGFRAAADFGYHFTPKIPFIFGDFSKETQNYNNGGRGGNATVFGNNGTAIGGAGGAGGPGGAGGAGGDATVTGDNAFAMGGEGGEAGQIDRGGKGGRGPLQVLMEDYPEQWKKVSSMFGLTPEDAMKYGRGGDGDGPTSTPQ